MMSTEQKGKQQVFAPNATQSAEVKGMDLIIIIVFVHIFVLEHGHEQDLKSHLHNNFAGDAVQR